MHNLLAYGFNIRRPFFDLSHFALCGWKIFCFCCIHLTFIFAAMDFNEFATSLSIYFFRSVRSLILSLPCMLFFMWIFAWILFLIWYHISLHIIRGSVKLPFCISTGRNSIKFGHKPQYFILTFDGKLIQYLSLAGWKYFFFL